MRVSRDTAYMEIAQVMARRSTCHRLQVGAAATVDKRIVAVGYNGALPSRPHCTDETCNIGGPCNNTVHAEANLIAFCARKGIALEGATLYCTHSPCNKCSELIIQSGIKVLWYKEEYRDTPWDLLIESGIKIQKYEVRVHYFATD